MAEEARSWGWFEWTGVIAWSLALLGIGIACALATIPTPSQ